MDLDFPKLLFELREQGYTCLRNFFADEELKDVRSATQRMIDSFYKERFEDPDYWNWVPPGEDPILYRIHNLEKDKDPSINRLTASPRFLKAVERMLGDAVEPTAFALIIKIPHRASPVPWHRDPVNVPPNCIYNFSIFLDDATPENGCLEILPGSHIFPKDFPINRDQRPDGSVFVPAQRGDVTIHDVRVVHGSGISKCDSQRRSIVVEFCPEWIQDLKKRALLQT